MNDLPIPAVWAIAAVAGFLAGSIPFGLLIGKAHGIDIRQHGSKNIGATNVGRVLGAKAWLLCFSLDVLKGFAPTLAAGLITGRAGQLFMPQADAWCWLAVLVAPVLGHMFSPWIGFKGGKGVASGLGSVLGVFPALTYPGLVALGVFALLLVAKRYVSLASMVAAFSLPVSVCFFFWRTGAPAWLVGADGSAGALPFVIATGLVAALVTFKHRANIARILAGTEPKVGAKRRPA